MSETKRVDSDRLWRRETMEDKTKSRSGNQSWWTAPLLTQRRPERPQYSSAADRRANRGSESSPESGTGASE